MPETADESAVLAQASPPAEVTFARIGIAILNLPAVEPAGTNQHHSLPDPETVYARVVDRLNADSRVSEVRAPSASSNKFRSLAFSAMRTTTSSLSAEPAPPHQHVHALSFRDPIAFSVNVPRRLQASADAAHTVPTEKYWAAWDGVVLFIGWTSTAPSPFGSAAGLSVLEVLRDAIREAGYSLRSQPCGPSCNYPFAHQDLLVDSASTHSEVRLEELDRWTTRIKTPIAGDRLSLASNLVSEFSYLGNVFAHLRSNGQVVRQSERAARKDLGDLLRLQYERAAITAMDPLRSIPERWRKRSNSSATARLIAGLWLRLASLDQNKRNWDADRYRYDQSGTEGDARLLFRSEFPDEVNGIETLDIDSLQASLVQMSAQADSRSLAWATAVGALAGGVLGAALGAVFGAISGQG
ncbi:hypothetical protein GCM10027515_16910 [Schumannella luteola]